MSKNGASTISASIARRRKVGNRVDTLHPGVVHQDVGLQLKILQRSDIEKVYRPSLSADLVRQCLGSGIVDVGDDNRRTPERQLPRARGADSARTAGDQRSAPGQRRHGTLSHFSSSTSAMQW
jgi:hypothetical protein